MLDGDAATSPAAPAPAPAAGGVTSSSTMGLAKPPLPRKARTLGRNAKQREREFPDVDWDRALPHFAACVAQDLHELNARFPSSPKHKIDVDPHAWTALLTIDCVMSSSGAAFFPLAAREVRAMMRRLVAQENAFLRCLQGDREIARALSDYVAYKTNGDARTKDRAARAAAARDSDNSNILHLADFSEHNDSSIASAPLSPVPSPLASSPRRTRDGHDGGDNDAFLLELEAELHADITNDVVEQAPASKPRRLRKKRQGEHESIPSRRSEADSDGLAELEGELSQSVTIEGPRKRAARMTEKTPAPPLRPKKSQKQVPPAKAADWNRTRWNAKGTNLNEDDQGNVPADVASESESDGLAELEKELQAGANVERVLLEHIEVLSAPFTAAMPSWTLQWEGLHWWMLQDATPIFVASAYSQPGVVRWLLINGADRSTACYLRQTPAQIVGECCAHAAVPDKRRNAQAVAAASAECLRLLNEPSTPPSPPTLAIAFASSFSSEIVVRAGASVGGTSLQQTIHKCLTRVSWQTPRSNGDLIETYELRYRRLVEEEEEKDRSEATGGEDHGEEDAAVDAAGAAWRLERVPHNRKSRQQVALVEGLQFNALYEFTLRSCNAVGKGEWSHNCRTKTRAAPTRSTRA
ncbi:hypothetical protein BBJ28_00014709 [Nothophytophthora sp. Chile5]|nr:hypothetical protein BBJ28_00014709 [Nothophytophthora sp. Chile5]